jgi:hypothetical protein
MAGGRALLLWRFEKKTLDLTQETKVFDTHGRDSFSEARLHKTHDI